MPDEPLTLAIDIGGTRLKSCVLDPTGAPIRAPSVEDTPRPATPRSVLRAIERLAAAHGRFDRVSCGFPGVVVDGVVHTAPNLDGGWAGFRLADELRARLGRPVRAANDADVQGYGAVEGRGVELTVTLGTGFGSALFVDGTLVPNLELGHHLFLDGETYEDLLGKRALDRDGPEVFNDRLRAALAHLTAVFNPRRIHVGGGNARQVTGPLPEGVRLVDNAAGLTGGIALWDPRRIGRG